MSTHPYPIPVDEGERLEALGEYRVIDTPPEEDFDRLVGLASRLFNVPTVLISLLEQDRQFFKARIGFDPCETSRDVSFCAHAIMRDDIMVVPDAALDPRFSTNPLVIGPPFIRFYAGKPLVTPKGVKLGTLCLIDTEPRAEFSPADRKNLADLAFLVMDRMEMRRLDYAKTISQARFENIAATSPDAIICSNTEREVTFWNRAAEKLFGYSFAEISKATTDILVPDSWHSLYEREVEHLQRGEKMELADRTVELSGLRKDGTAFPAEFSLSTWNEGNTTSVGCIVRDITERRENEARLFRLASLDPLTDLPNRGAWRARLVDMLGADAPVTVLMLDLDGFKEVNDTSGHAAGDAVLCEVGRRLRSCCDDAVLVGRLGGDEFVALLPGNDARAATVMAKRLGELIEQPFDFLGQRISVGVSIGVALAPQHGSRAEDVLGAADLALYKAKAAGRGRYEMFVPSFREVAIARRRFEQELRQAFERSEFELFYQPQVRTANGRLTGAEALIRWHHPERGLLSPASFIDVLSQKPSAPAVGEWIVRTACKQAAEWRRHVPQFRVGVNLFESQFKPGLVAVVSKALDDYGLPAEALELEIVENILLREDPSTMKLLQDLRTLGVGLAFDDYGTGYASLSLLKRFPVTKLKIDRSFVRGVDVDSEDAAVVKAIVYLGESFGLDVIAEGVETDAQRKFLAEHGCMESQGYLFGKPVPASEFDRAFVAASRPTLAETDAGSIAPALQSAERLMKADKGL